jgi:transcription initiation factor IIF auxiliary subunit
VSGRLLRLAAALLAALTLATAASALAALTVKNTSSYTGAGRWNWRVFVDADAETLRQIECVEYTLHPTFPDPVRRVCNQSETKFALSSNGWGTFTIKVRIQYRDGRIELREHPLVFTQAPAATPLSLKARNWAREIEPGWWEWGVYLEGPAADLDHVRCVEYTLHPTFPNPVRTVCSRSDRFLLTARGWGTFDIKIKVLLTDDSMYPMSYPLTFR